MGKGYFITGTDTNIGKTFVTTILTKALQNKEIDTIPYKPIQSGTVMINERPIGEDVAFYKEHLPLKEDFSYYNTYTLTTPVSPHLASKLENVILNETIILQKYHELMINHEVVFVEGAGGIAVPLKEDFGTIDLIKLLNIDVLVVTTLKLGTLNHTMLTIEYLRKHEINIKGLIINNVPENMNVMETDNLNMIKKLSGIDVIALIPHFKEESPLKNYNDQLNEFIKFEKLI
jgi:dethiobiotin synthetase